MSELDEKKKIQQIHNVVVINGGVAVLGSNRNVTIGKADGKRAIMIYKVLVNNPS
jgi:hypothetical protein